MLRINESAVGVVCLNKILCFQDQPLFRFIVWILNGNKSA